MKVPVITPAVLVLFLSLAWPCAASTSANDIATHGGSTSLATVNRISAVRAFKRRAVEIENAIIAREMQIIESRRALRTTRAIFKNADLEAREEQRLKSRTFSPGPTAEDIVEENDARRVFQEAWDESFPMVTTVKESGGWVYADSSNRLRLYFCIASNHRAKTINRSSAPKGPVSYVDLTDPDLDTCKGAPHSYVVVATFITHPLATMYGGNPAAPTEEEQHEAYERGVPGIIISEHGLTGYGPTKRDYMGGRSTFPGGHETYHGQNKAGTVLDHGRWYPVRAHNE